MLYEFKVLHTSKKLLPSRLASRSEPAPDEMISRILNNAMSNVMYPKLHLNNTTKSGDVFGTVLYRQSEELRMYPLSFSIDTDNDSCC